MTSPNLARSGNPDELSLQNKLGGPLCQSSVRTSFDTGLARAEVPTSYRHGASSKTLCAGTRPHAQMETPAVDGKLPATLQRHDRVSHPLTDTASIESRAELRRGIASQLLGRSELPTQPQNCPRVSTLDFLSSFRVTTTPHFLKIASGSR
ncbi:hypothetical protein Acr_22g0007950 [Actinidia rufa]|uniref:Uncharacterized protein n=1 Tax=Actinidia rufa TaxID=165716 RepID=A0A7J0GKQ2_9ERIC|nr:hypothetical protein Acr_22g0007950 [Actinidia rufa]